MRIDDFPGWPDLKACIAETGIVLSPRCWIAGGALLRAATGEPQDADLDFWFADEAAFRGAQYKIGRIEGVYTAFSYTVYRAGRKIQLIRKVFPGGMHECIGAFDFTVCQLAWDGEGLAYGVHTEADIKDRVLRFVGGSASTPERLAAYVARGYRITTDTVQSALAAKPRGYDYDLA